MSRRHCLSQASSMVTCIWIRICKELPSKSDHWNVKEKLIPVKMADLANH